MDPAIADSPQELINRHHGRRSPLISAKLLAAMQTLEALELGGSEQLDLVISLLQQHSRYCKSVIAEALEAENPRMMESVVGYSIDAIRFDNCVDMLSSIRFG